MVLLEIIIVVVLVIIVLAFIAMYNGFIQKRNRVQDAWAQIDVQLKRRYDLIPNLIRHRARATRSTRRACSLRSPRSEAPSSLARCRTRPTQTTSSARR